jgi:hypothetical protein
MIPFWGVMLIGFGFWFMSFMLQLTGHAIFEEFEAPMLPWHGFVAAPILEWCCFCYRIGMACNYKTWPVYLPDPKALWAYVDDIRQKARGFEKLL